MPANIDVAHKDRSIRLDGMLAEAIARIASGRGLAESDVIRDLLRRGLEHYEREREIVERVLGGQKSA